jgi:hypothetical protein
LLQSTHIAAGWTGTLSIARGGNGTTTGISAATQTALDGKINDTGDTMSGNFNITATTASTSRTTGALVVGGGVGISGAFWSNSPINLMSTTTGPLIVINNQLNNPAIDFQRNGTRAFLVACDNAPVFAIQDADSSHGVYLSQNVGTWASLSDARMSYKQNARTVTGLLPKLEHFRLVEYGEGHAQIGVIAQELHKFAPKLVDKGDDTDRVVDRVTEPGLWGVRSGDAAFAALQVAKEIWENLDKRLQALEDEKKK